MPAPLIDDLQREHNCAFELSGATELLNSTRCALLVSRAEKSPLPDAPWLHAVISAVKNIVRRNETLICGTGRLAWDVALLTCRDAGGNAIVVLNGELSSGAMSDLSTFAPSKLLLLWPKLAIDNASRLILRDRLVGRLAQKACSINMRANGNMEAVAIEILTRGGSVETLPLPKTISISDRNPAPKISSDEHHSLLNIEPRLTHFTRAPEGAWPGEPRAEYLRWLTSGEQFEPRGDFHTLRRILSERRIRGCGRLIPGAVKMVCLSAAHPQTLIDHAVWRKGLRRWTASNYALSFPLAAAEKLGARAVIYQSDSNTQSREDACFTQPAKSAGRNWEYEAEWRIRGDVELSLIDAKQISAIVSTSAEAAEIIRDFGIQASVLRRSPILK